MSLRLSWRKQENVHGFSVIMLAGTDAGDAYTFSQYEKMFRNAEFVKTALHPVPNMPQQVLLSEK